MKYSDPSGENAITDFVEGYLQAVNSLYIFGKNYYYMREANTVNADKYFHCMANCQSASLGKCGAISAVTISAGREITDHYIKGDTVQDVTEDSVANLTGLLGGTTSSRPPVCSSVCSSYRPETLDFLY